MPEQGSYFLSTYAKIALSDWHLLAGYIQRYSTPIQKPAESPAETVSQQAVLLSDLQIAEALKGPYSSFLKQKMLDYGNLQRVKSKHITTQEEFFKREMNAPLPTEKDTLSAEIVKQVSKPTLESLQTQLNQITQEHHQQWVDALSYWKNGLLQYFDQSKLAFSELEIQDFNWDQSASELFKTFTESKVELPKLKKGCTTFGAYLKLKSTLAVYSSLSRRMQAHSEKEVSQVLKPLSNYFDDVEKYELQMLDSQHAQTLQILQPIAFALPA